MPNWGSFADAAESAISSAAPVSGAASTAAELGGSKYLKINMAERGEGGIIRYGAGSAGASFRNAQEMNSALSKVMKAMGMTADEMQHALQFNGLSGVVGKNADGSPYIDATRTGSRNPVPSGVTNVQSSPGDTGPGSSGRTPRSGPESAAGQQAAQAAADRAARAGSGGSGGASGGGGGGGITTPRVGPFPTATPPVGEGGGGGADAMAIDPNAPLGIPPITSRMQPGSEYFSGGSFPSAGNPYEGLDANSNLYDVIAAMAGSQVGNQQAALNTLGGVFDESMGGVSAQQRGRIGDLLANPFSMDEGTLARIMGRNVEGINERAQRAMEQSAQSRASAGIRPDSGIAQAQDQQIRTQAMGQAQSAETQARIQQSMQNQVDLRSALGAAGGAIQQDLGMRERLAQGAAQGVLGQTTITGNEYLTNALLAAQGAGSGQAQMPQGGASLRMG